MRRFLSPAGEEMRETKISRHQHHSAGEYYRKDNLVDTVTQHRLMLRGKNARFGGRLCLDL